MHESRKFVSFILAMLIFIIGVCAYVGFKILFGWIAFGLKTNGTLYDYFEHIAEKAKKDNN